MNSLIFILNNSFPKLKQICSFEKKNNNHSASQPTLFSLRKLGCVCARNVEEGDKMLVKRAFKVCTKDYLLKWTFVISRQHLWR